MDTIGAGEVAEKVSGLSVAALKNMKNNSHAIESPTASSQNTSPPHSPDSKKESE